MSNVYGLIENIQIARGVVIEGATGGRGNDRLIGNAVQNTLIGGAGHDTLVGGGGNDTLQGAGGADVLDGGAGFDIADYSRSAEAVVVGLDGRAATSGDAAGDTYFGIEGLSGSAFADTLYGSAQDELLRGNGGSDLLVGSAGSDTLDGGTGFDTADYSGSDAGVAINLAASSGVGGYAEGDSLSGIERIVGSDFADQLIGSDGAQTLIGGAGDDTGRRCVGE